jgi:hypothetical protein
VETGSKLSNGNARLTSAISEEVKKSARPPGQRNKIRNIKWQNLE